MLPLRPSVLVVSLALLLPLAARAQPGADDPPGVRTLLALPFDAPLPEAAALAGDGWSVDDGTPHDGPNLRHRGTSAGTLRLTLPPADGNVRGLALAYVARRTGSYPRDALRAHVTAGTDAPLPLWPSGGGLPEETSTWAASEHPLPAAAPADPLAGPRVVVLEAAGGTSASSNLRLDDVRLVARLHADAAPRAVTLRPAPGATAEAVVTVHNTSTDALAFAPPALVGAGAATGGLGVAPAGAFALAAGEARPLTVACGPGGGAATLTLVHDHGTLAVPVACAEAEARGTFGWAAPSSSAVEAAAGHALALDLAVPRPLQALAFTLTWDAPGAWTFRSLDRCADLAAADLAVHAVAPGAVRALLWTDDPAGIPPGAFSACLAAVFDAGAPPGDSLVARFALTDVDASDAAPDGATMALDGPREQTTVLHRAWAALAATPAAVDAGAVAVGQRERRTITLANPGTVALTVTAAATDEPIIAVDAALPLVVAAGSAVDVPVVFAPTRDRFGARAARVTLVHDGEGAPSTVAVTGVGTGGWGDGSGDGQVDVEDLLLVVDAVLARPGVDVLPAAADVHPDGAPDGALTTGDLAVLVQAVAAGVRPDGTELPPPLPVAEKLAASFGAVHVTADGRLEVVLTRPVRGLQLAFEAPEPLAPGAAPGAAPGVPGALVRAAYDAARGRLGVVALRTDGGGFAPGPVALLPLGGAPGRLLHAVAVSTDGRRGTVRSAAAPTGADAPSAALRVGRPYPNPFAPGAARLRIPVEGSRGAALHADVYDALGRRVAALRSSPADAALVWDGRDAAGRRVPPGVYLVAVTAGDEVVHRRVVVR